MPSPSLAAPVRTLSVGSTFVVGGFALAGLAIALRSVLFGVLLAFPAVALVYFGWVFLATGLADVVAVGVQRAE